MMAPMFLCSFSVLVAVSVFSTGASAAAINKIYLVGPTKYQAVNRYVLGVTYEVDAETNVEKLTSVFGVIPLLWDYLKSTTFKNFDIQERTIDQVPVDGLLNLVRSYPLIYSEVLPHLLKSLPAETIAAELPGNLLDTLTPSARAEIGEERLKELRKYSV